MDKKEFKKLIKKNAYQVFLFSAPTPIPINIGLHYWFVVNNKGQLNRWDLLARKLKIKERWGHLHKNVAKPTRGMEIFPFTEHFLWRSKLIEQLFGKKGSLAEKMVKFIEKSPENYPYLKKYSLVPGPNSNTYIQWVINKFPKSGFNLSWRAIGKNYKIKS